PKERKKRRSNDVSTKGTTKKAPKEHEKNQKDDVKSIEKTRKKHRKKKNIPKEQRKSHQKNDFEKATGAGIQLKDSNDYKKFILDNKKATKEKKKFIIMKKNIIKQNEKPIENSEDSSSDEIKIKTKKQKTIPKESSLSEAEKLHGQYVNLLREKYWCTKHTNACLVEDNFHNKLTSMHLSIWAKEIINGIGSSEVPPTHPIFKSQHIRNSNEKDRLQNEIAPLSIDNEYGNTGEYLAFKKEFKDENITTDMIFDLMDNEFDRLGVKKIGWRKVLKKAAKLYNNE
ncbi:6490_t:CDS:2, partial [Dentiscutata erythropus]